MARRTRFHIPGACYHVFLRGHNRCAVFLDDEDRRRFLREVRRAALGYGTAIHNFVLMTTHYHLLASPADEHALPDTVKYFSEEYVRYFNRKYERSGTAWNGRYHAVIMKDERQLLTCMRYIELNPVTANIVTSPADYRWSSYAAHALGARIPWLTKHRTYLALGPTAETRQAVYRALCDAL